MLPIVESPLSVVQHLVQFFLHVYTFFYNWRGTRRRQLPPSYRLPAIPISSQICLMPYRNGNTAPRGGIRSESLSEAGFLCTVTRTFF